MGEFTKVQFNALATGEADFASIYQSLQSTLSTLESQLNTHLAEWSGSARQAYYAAQTKWNAAAADMAAVVSQLSSVVGTANANYARTEQVNAGMWGD